MKLWRTQGFHSQSATGLQHLVITFESNQMYPPELHCDWIDGYFLKELACIWLDTFWIHAKKSQWNHNVSADKCPLSPSDKCNGQLSSWSGLCATLLTVLKSIGPYPMEWALTSSQWEQRDSSVYTCWSLKRHFQGVGVQTGGSWKGCTVVQKWCTSAAATVVIATAEGCGGWRDLDDLMLRRRLPWPAKEDCPRISTLEQTNP